MGPTNDTPASRVAPIPWTVGGWVVEPPCSRFGVLACHVRAAMKMPSGSHADTSAWVSEGARAPWVVYRGFCCLPVERNGAQPLLGARIDAQLRMVGSAAVMGPSWACEAKLRRLAK